MPQIGAQRTGFLFGLTAALALLATLWGADAWALARADALFPWAKAALAAVCLLPAFGLLGWLSMRSHSLLFSGAAWAVAGVVVGWLAGQVAFLVFPWTVARFAPQLAGWISYGYGVGPQARVVLASILCGVLFLAGGLTIRGLVDSATQSPYLAARASAILLWAGLFAVCGGLVDGLLQRPLRQPVTTLDGLITFRLSDPLGLQETEAHRLRANVLDPVEELLPRPRRVVVSSFDEFLVQVQLVIDFEGSLVQCTFIENRPVFCERLEDKPLRPSGGRPPGAPGAN